MPMRGMPMAEENLAAESKKLVAKLRRSGGNQRPIALALAGKNGASPTPSSGARSRRWECWRRPRLRRTRRSRGRRQCG